VVNRQKSEEQLKTDIFCTYILFFNESSSDRRKVNFGRLCDLIFRWCKGYLYQKEADEMRVEIVETVINIVKLQKEEKYFFGYLKKSLDNARAQYFNNRVLGPITELKSYKGKKIKDINKILEMNQSNRGIKLSEDERLHLLSTYYEWDEKSTRECLKLLDMLDQKFFDGLGPNADNKDQTDFLDFKVSSPYIPDASTDPQDEYFTKLDGIADKEIIEQVLQDTQNRTRECYRSLFTAYCINKSLLTEHLIPLLDNKILEDYQKKKEKPKQHEIYQKYHPEIQKEGAEALSSKMIKDFLKKIRTAMENSKKPL